MATPNFQFTSSIKFISIVLSLLITFAGCLYAVDDRYVTQKQAATSLQIFDSAVKKDMINLELQILNNNLDSLNDQYYKLRRLLQNAPGDTELREDLQRVNDRRKDIQNKIDEKLEIHQF